MLRLLLLSLFMLAAFAPAQAQERFDAPPYAQRGVYAIGTMELTIEDEDRPLDVTLWYPADATPGEEPIASYPLSGLLRVPGEAYRDASLAADGAPFPLILFSHGSESSRVLSLFLTEHLASRGFIVMAADHPGNNVDARLNRATDFPVAYALRPFDVLRQLDYAAEVLNAPGGQMEGMIDMEQVGVMGHSFGGWTALSAAGGRVDFPALRAFCEANPNDSVCFLADDEAAVAQARGYDEIPAAPWEAVADERIGAVVALAPWNGPLLELSQVTAPTLIVVGSGDAITLPERDAYDIYDRLPGDRSLMTLELAGHNIFIDACPDLLIQFGFQSTCTDPVWDMARAHDLTNHAVTAFFQATLRGDRDADAALQPNTLDFRGVTFQRD